MHDTYIRQYIEIELKHNFSWKLHDKASTFHYMKYNFYKVYIFIHKPFPTDVYLYMYKQYMQAIQIQTYHIMDLQNL